MKKAISEPSDAEQWPELEHAHTPAEPEPERESWSLTQRRRCHLNEDKSAEAILTSNTAAGTTSSSAKQPKHSNRASMPARWLFSTQRREALTIRASVDISVDCVFMSAYSGAVASRSWKHAYHHILHTCHVGMDPHLYPVSIKYIITHQVYIVSTLTVNTHRSRIAPARA